MQIPKSLKKRKRKRGEKVSENKFKEFIMYAFLVIAKSMISAVFFFVLYGQIIAFGPERSPLVEYVDIYLYLILTSILGAMVVIVLFYIFKFNVNFVRAKRDYFSPRAILNLALETFVMAFVYQFLKDFYAGMFSFGMIILYYSLFRIGVKLIMRVFSSYLSLSVEAYASRVLPIKAPAIFAMLVILFVLIIKISLSNYMIVG